MENTVILVSTKTLLLSFIALVLLWVYVPRLERAIRESVMSIVLFWFYRAFGMCNKRGVLTGRFKVAQKAKIASLKAAQVQEQSVPKSIQPEKTDGPKNRRVSPALTTASELPVRPEFGANDTHKGVFVNSDIDLSEPAYKRAGIKIDWNNEVAA